MNNKDYNADLGNQTIEGTSPPIALDAEIVVPDSVGTPTAEELDKQLEELLATPIEPATVITPPPPVDDLDKQLEALITESEKIDKQHDEIDAINAQLDALLSDNWEEIDDTEPDVAEAVIIPDAPSGDEAVIIPPTDEPVIVPTDEPVEPAVIFEDEPTAPESTDAPTDEEPVAPVSPAVNSEAEAAREMLEQTKQLMEQIRAQAAAQAKPVQPDPNAESREMMRQAQLMLEQARMEQQRLQQQQAQRQYSPIPPVQPVPPTMGGGYGAPHEVDRLKNELDGMRELVNRLTYTISQMQGGVPQQQIPLMYAQQQQQRRDSDDRDHYRKLESELEHMRREIMEKDLRDREKELDRRQKEAESNVKDIRPEMVQMSDARDNVPVPISSQSANVGGEFIPLANGVYYSIKDKQVYVMTPASNAAAASPTIEPKRSAPPPRRAAAKRRPVAHRRPGAPMHRRPGGPRRPMRPGHR